MGHIILGIKGEHEGKRFPVRLVDISMGLHKAVAVDADGHEVTFTRRKDGKLKVRRMDTFALVFVDDDGKDIFI